MKRTTRPQEPTTTARRPVQTSTLRRLAGPTLALVLVAGACSDADDGLDTAACDAYADVSASFFGDPAEVPTKLEALESAMPDDLADDTETYVSGLTAGFEGDEEAMTDEAFLDASSTLGDAVFDDCGTAGAIDVDGVDFGFDGLPEELDAGRTVFRFTNATEAGEAHEMFIARKADGVTESLSELLALPEEEGMAKIIPTGVVFSDAPGGQATTLVDLEPGEYVAICMIPTGGGGPPHFVEGMAAEFTVS